MRDYENMSELEKYTAQMHDVRNGIIGFVRVDMGLGIYGCEPHEDDGLIRVPDGWYESIGQVQTIEPSSRNGWELNDDDPRNYVIVEYTSHGDCCGGLAEKVNCQTLMELASEYDVDEDYPEMPEDWYSEGVGHFSSRWFELKCLPYLPVSVYEAIDGLALYPLLDDSLHSELEMSLKDEDWESFGRSDLIRECQQFLAPLDSEDEALGAWLDEESSEPIIDGLYYGMTMNEGWGWAEGLTWVFPDIDIKEFIEACRKAMSERIKA